MLHEHQRTSAPSAVSVSMSTAVCTVICSEPAMRAPLKGCAPPNSARQAIRPGISASARSISRRPKSACEMSLTLYCCGVFVSFFFLSWGLKAGEEREGVSEKGRVAEAQ